MKAGLRTGLAVGGNAGWVVVTCACCQARPEHVPVILRLFGELIFWHVRSQRFRGEDGAIQEYGGGFGPFTEVTFLF
jgi:hypothetical protein